MLTRGTSIKSTVPQHVEGGKSNLRGDDFLLKWVVVARWRPQKSPAVAGGRVSA